MEGRRAVGQRHHLLGELLGGRQAGVLHRLLVGVEEDDVEVLAGLVAVLADDPPAGLAVAAHGRFPVVADLAHLVDLRRVELDDLHERHGNLPLIR